MTGPSSNPRPRVDQLTDDQLDQLYAEIERMKLLVAASSEDGQAIRMAAQYAERAIKNGERAEKAEADRDALIDERDKLDRKLTTMTDVARSNLKHVQTIVPDLEKAEAAIARVRAELHALNSEVRGLNPIALAGRRDAVARIRAALDGTA